MGVYELNGNILRADLKESTVQLFRRDSNGSFQAFGAVIEKEGRKEVVRCSTVFPSVLVCVNRIV